MNEIHQLSVGTGKKIVQISTVKGDKKHIYWSLLYLYYPIVIKMEYIIDKKFDTHTSKGKN